jgi:hypothetical protein
MKVLEQGILTFVRYRGRNNSEGGNMTDGHQADQFSEEIRPLSVAPTSVTSQR